MSRKSKTSGVNFHNIDPKLDWDLVEKLGEGAFGAVWRSIKLPKAESSRVGAAPREIAVKRLQVGVGEQAAAEREVMLTSKLASPHVVQFFGCYWWDGSVFLCLELCEASLQDLVDKAKENGIPEPRIKDAATAIFSGLRDLHRLNICHRDIKPGNVLIRTDSTCCLADFGISRESNATVMNFETMIGSPFFMAPEQVESGSSDKTGVGYDEKIDVWAAGITLLCCTDGRPPFYDMNPLHALFMIGKEGPPTMKNIDKYSGNLLELVTLALTKSPFDRPSCLELLKLPFFKSSSSSSSKKSSSRHGSSVSSQKRLSKRRSQRDSAPAAAAPAPIADDDLDAEIVSAALNAVNQGDPFDIDDDDEPPPPPPPKRVPSEKDVDDVTTWLQTRKDILSALQERFMMNDGYIGPPIEELRGQAFLKLLEQVDKASEQERQAHDLRRKEARQRRKLRKLERERRRAARLSGGAGGGTSKTSSSSSSAVNTIDETSSLSNPSSEPSSHGGSKDNTVGSSGPGAGLRDQLRDVEKKLERLRKLAGNDETTGSSEQPTGQGQPPAFPPRSSSYDFKAAVAATSSDKQQQQRRKHSKNSSSSGSRRRTSVTSSDDVDDEASSAQSTSGSAASKSLSSSSRSTVMADKFCQVCQLNLVAAKVTLDNGSKLLLCKPCAIASKTSGRVPSSPNASAGKRPTGPQQPTAGATTGANKSSPLAATNAASSSATGSKPPQSSPPPISSWTEKDVAQWVTDQLRTDVYRDAFIDNLVNGELLLTLCDADLKEILKIDPPLHRRRLVLEIGRLKEKVAAGQGAWPKAGVAETVNEWRSL